MMIGGLHVTFMLVLVLEYYTSRTSAQWSSGVAVANATAELPPLGVPAVLAEHASHLCACSQTSIEITHIYQI